MIPAFALGRVQEMVYALHELYRAGKIPAINMYVDSPLAVDATTVFRMHPEVFDRREQMLENSDKILDFSLLQYIRAVEDSKRLNTLLGPMIIIAASGMAEAGRILHHLANGIGDPKNCVLFVGFQAENTLGRRILDGARQVRIFGDMHEVRAEIESIGGYSAHADRKSSAPGSKCWAARSAGPSSCTARRGPPRRWPRSSRKKGWARSSYLKWVSRSTCEAPLRWAGWLLATALVGYALLFGWVWRESRLDQRKAADAIVVLGAAQYNGRPSPVLKARLDHAIELYRQGLAPSWW